MNKEKMGLQLYNCHISGKLQKSMKKYIAEMRKKNTFLKKLLKCYAPILDDVYCYIYCVLIKEFIQ